jgi:DNA-binding NarL/FixJ family response regulator
MVLHPPVELAPFCGKKGAKWRYALSARHTTIQGRSMQEIVPDPNSRPTVVIADDNPLILKKVVELLVGKFTVVAHAEDGHAALRHIKELRPQLAILDVSMPKIDGLEVARQLNKAQSSTRVVFLSILEGEEFIAEAKRCSHGWVTKMRLRSDLYLALYAALEGNFFASDFARVSVRQRGDGVCRAAKEVE